VTGIPIPAGLTIAAWIFISLGLASAAVIVADIYVLGYREHMKIMEAVWPLTALYAGPAGLAAYFRWGRPMSHRWMQASHNGMRAKPFWAGTAVSTTHCRAGCALGDLIAECRARRPAVYQAPGLRAASRSIMPSLNRWRCSTCRPAALT
jgi:hypothetical protein